jgi:hypothetical protein
VRLQDEHVCDVVEGGVAATTRAKSASSSSANKPKVSEFSAERFIARTDLPAVQQEVFKKPWIISKSRLALSVVMKYSPWCHSRTTLKSSPF